MKVNLSQQQLYDIFSKAEKTGLCRSAAQKCLSSLSSTSENTNISSIELEKHLKDYNSGYGNISATTETKIKSQNNNTSNMLAFEDPSLNQAYQLYQTGLGYSKQSRYVNSLNTATKHYRTIIDSHKEYLSFKKESENS